MLPKRKFIKKVHRRAEQTEGLPLPPVALLDKLRSGDGTQVEQGLAFVASMCMLPGGGEGVALLAELVGVLQRGVKSEVYQCLYGLSNLIQLEPAIVPRLFQIGLHTALLRLDSNDKDLLRPILALMGTLHGLLPEQFKYLETGVVQSLTVQHLISGAKQTVLSFLLRTEASSLRPQIYEKVYQLLNNEQSLKTRASCAAILMRNQATRQKTGNELLQFVDEVVGDIDLQKQYQTNIVHVKPLEKPKQQQTDMMEQEEEIGTGQHVNYDTFLDAVQGVEIILQAVLILLEEAEEEKLQWEEQEEVEQEEETNKMEEKQIVNNVKENTKAYSLVFINYFTSKSQCLVRNTLLNFGQGQNIVQLALRILGYCLQIPRESLSIISLRCMENVVEMGEAELIVEVVGVGLYLLLRCPLPLQARGWLLSLGEKVLLMKETYRECWLCLLQLYSLHFNPERCAVSVEENRRVGAILRQLLINIPCLSLQEWRGQTIDTIFDVFSNQQFDGYLVQLGLCQLLQHVVLQAGGGKKKRFIRQVLTDIKRFLEYKRKRIKF